MQQKGGGEMEKGKLILLNFIWLMYEVRNNCESFVLYYTNTVGIGLAYEIIVLMNKTVKNISTNNFVSHQISVYYLSVYLNHPCQIKN